jgi:hypothetical protein
MERAMGIERNAQRLFNDFNELQKLSNVLPLQRATLWSCQAQLPPTAASKTLQALR